MSLRADYDAAAKWTPAPDWATARLQREGWTAQVVIGLSQVLLSGDLAQAAEDLAAPVSEVGLWGIAQMSAVVVRIARDRALLVSNTPLPLASGWHEAGWAASPAADAFAVFDIAGPAMPEVVREAVSADLDAGSPSAATLFAAVPAFLYRTAPDAARLHVEAALAPYVWRWLQLRADSVYRRPL